MTKKIPNIPASFEELFEELRMEQARLCTLNRLYDELQVENIILQAENKKLNRQLAAQGLPKIDCENVK